MLEDWYQLADRLFEGDDEDEEESFKGNDDVGNIANDSADCFSLVPENQALCIVRHDRSHHQRAKNTPSHTTNFDDDGVDNNSDFVKVATAKMTRTITRTSILMPKILRPKGVKPFQVFIGAKGKF
jgi:hypothetical protein